MAVYPKSFTVSDFVLQDDGQYMASIPAATHGLGATYRVGKMHRRNDNRDWENQLATYKILADGTFEYYVSEPCVCRVYLEGDE